MPEGPEVAITADSLHDACHGWEIVDVLIHSGRYAAKSPEGYRDFRKSLPIEITHISSMGKFLYWDLDFWMIWNTFGMSGYWCVEGNREYRRLEFQLRQGSHTKSVYYHDMRNFGTFKFSRSRDDLDSKIASLSPDFLRDEDWNLDKMKNSRKDVTVALMSQGYLGSGIGNYLVCEILYRAKIRPDRICLDVSADERSRLEYWIRYLMKLAYRHNHTKYLGSLGTCLRNKSPRDYHPEIQLQESSFQYQVYRREFDRHGNPVQVLRLVKQGSQWRSTWYCPDVQV